DSGGYCMVTCSTSYSGEPISVTYMVPVFAIVYGALFIGEPVTLRMIACGVVIALGTALTTGLVGGAKKAG
ncbi:MAG TPA: hypothetical protein PKD73_15495, partial [Burkholderiaceae bacterium]|nr:hypothetical protein [Burkholderiaceae bacterium]